MSNSRKKSDAEKPEVQPRPFDFINNYDPMEVLRVIEREYPLFIAIILSYLEPPKASVLLQNLPKEKKGEVARLIATMDVISLEIIRGIERSVKKKLSAKDPYGTAGGVDNAVEILELADQDSKDQIMRYIKAKDPELADEMQNRRLAAGRTLSDNEINDLAKNL